MLDQLDELNFTNDQGTDIVINQSNNPFNRTSEPVINQGEINQCEINRSISGVDNSLVQGDQLNITVFFLVPC